MIHSLIARCSALQLHAAGRLEHIHAALAVRDIGQERDMELVHHAVERFTLLARYKEVDVPRAAQRVGGVAVLEHGALE